MNMDFACAYNCGRITLHSETSDQQHELLLLLPGICRFDGNASRLRPCAGPSVLVTSQQALAPGPVNIGKVQPAPALPGLLNLVSFAKLGSPG